MALIQEYVTILKDVLSALNHFIFDFFIFYFFFAS